MQIPGMYSSSIKQIIGTGETDSYKYFEAYSDDLGDYFYKFDSWNDLSRIVAGDMIDTRQVRLRGPLKWKLVRQQSLAAWRDVLVI